MKPSPETGKRKTATPEAIFRSIQRPSPALSLFYECELLLLLVVELQPAGSILLLHITALKEARMRSMLLWLIGVPIPIILLLALCTHHF